MVWSVSADRSPGRGMVPIQPGGHFFLVAANEGSTPVDVRVDLGGARGVALAGASGRRVEAGSAQAFEVRHHLGAEIGGAAMLSSADGARPDWWERRSWRTEVRPLALAVRLREERWRVGAPVVVIAPGANCQYVRVWNDADRERPLETAAPAGFAAQVEGQPAGGPAAVAPDSSLEICLRLTGRR
ncbi:MAG TPA: hypothetical protein VLH79_11235, partial [Chthonomonadales bacterium]|nr:hypothetical protein [Chthonomonadales bacterium]